MSDAAGAPKSFGEALLAVVVLGVLTLLILPLPPVALDLLLALSIGAGVLMLVISLSLSKPSDFSVFPSLLLIVTLFRLGLNVATTRLILLHGSTGPGAAGHIIQTFGHFAVGGSLIVGAVVFLILLVINFAVISKGSNRISEVAARFTLDALPGKQMSIDAELAAGVINDTDARARRKTLEQEAEFFGAMDGASKFVRGDAMAGLAITGVNILGGLAAGLLRDHISLSSAAEAYTLLTVGDGLVSQIPALLVSTAAGIVVTRAGAGAALSSQLATQIFGRPQALQVSAGILGALAVLPGMPTLAFTALAAGAVLLSRRASPKSKADSAAAAAAATQAKPERIQDVLALEALELQMGVGLLPIIDPAKGGELPARITALRRQLVSDLGVVMPSIHLRDNLRLEPNEYCLLFRGMELGRGVAHLGRLMALDPRGQAPTLPGIPGKDPAFGLPSMWILPQDRARAEQGGLTLVDPASVITTHLSELLRRNAFELVGRQEAQELLASCAKEAPKLVEDTVPGALTLGELVRVLRGLLREGISVRDLRSILEAVADAAPRSKDTAFLVEQARRRLSRQITARIADRAGAVQALVLDRATEDLLRASLVNNEGEAAVNPDIEVAKRLLGALESNAATLTNAGQPTVVLAPPDLRRAFFDFASRFVPDLMVVSARELTPGTTIHPAGTLNGTLLLPQAAAAPR